MKEELIILNYDPQYQNYFKSLNLEWLKKYFNVEPIDEELLTHPEEIIKNGGEIFFAKLDDEIVGTCALLKLNDNILELAKMAVTEKAQGKKIGKKLGSAAIDYARSKNYKTLILESNRILDAALNLYIKLGFKEVPDYVSSKYSRSNIKMKLEL